LRPRKWRVTEPNRDHLGSRKTLMIIMIMIIRMLVIMIVHLSMVVGIIMVIISMIPYTVWLFNIAMEQDPSIDDLLLRSL
jgi:accessory gene regulator protein AgrB